VRLVLQVELDHKEREGIPEIQEMLGIMEHQDNRELQEQLVQVGPLVQQGLLDPREKPEVGDKMVNQVKLETVVQLVPQVPQGRLVVQERLDYLDQEVQLALQVQQDRQEKLVIEGIQEAKEPKDLKELKELVVLVEVLVLLEKEGH
jgi:hypothetical protein